MEDYKSILDKIPELDVYKSNLKNLTDIDFNNSNYSEITESVLRHTIVDPPVPTVDLTFSPENLIYRVRKNISRNECLTNIQTFGYPDNIYCTKNGRANMKGTSVFYCSNYAATSLLETKPQNNDMYYLSIWQPQVNDPVIAATFCKEINWVKDGRVIRKTLIEKRSAPLSSSGVDKTVQLNYLIDFIINAYKEDTESYGITSWISHYILFQRNLNCILYQSVVSNSFCNFVFRPDFVDKYFRLQKVIALQTINLNDNLLDYSLLEVGEVSDDKILWRQLTEHEKNYFHKMLKEGQELIRAYP